MKTIWITLKKGSLIPMILVALLAFVTMACEKESVLPSTSPDVPKGIYSGDILTETFLVGPEGISLNTFDGSVILEIPGGTVHSPTEFTLTSYPLNGLDIGGINVVKRGISLKKERPDLPLNEPVKVSLSFHMPGFQDGNQTALNDLTIYKVYPDFKTVSGCESISECCTDVSCKMIFGCIDKCGFYVVGEN
jgi:hypothetical protein